MKRLLCTAAALTLLAPATAMAQDGTIQTSGGFQVGVQTVDIDGSNAKFNEYRDIRDGFYLYNLDFEAIDTERGLYLDFSGKNLIRDNQRLNFGVGSFGQWGLDVERNETPKRISDRAKTPYNYQGDGLFTVPRGIGIDGGVVLNPETGETGTRGRASLAPNVAQQRENDRLVEEYLGTDGNNLNPVVLGTQRKRDSVSIGASPLDFLKVRLTYTDERKEGNKVTYGPIGDRPPRTMNIQMPEPVDYRTRELKAEADLFFEGIQGRVAYQLSDFNNNVDTLTWQNIFFTSDNPEVGDYIVDANNRRVSAFGQRALDPDNRYHNISGSVGVDLAMDSRLTASAAYGWMKQDNALLPYSASDLGVDLFMPRATADAEINTTLFNLDYSINPINRLNLRAFYRYYDLDNKTTSTLGQGFQVDADGNIVTNDAGEPIPVRWEGVVQDVIGPNTGRDYRTNRNNLPYGYTKQNFGADARYTMAFWRTTLGLGYEREEIDRDFREADTDENIFKFSLRTQPTDWVFVRASYLYGDRKGKNYNNDVTSQSYAYTFGEGNDGNDPEGISRIDNPQFLFANHPDLRKYDVSDRERNQFDISVMTTPIQALDFGANYSYRKDDFDSGVRPVQPLRDTEARLPNDTLDSTDPNYDRLAFTPGIQLGLLDEKRQNYGINAYYAPVQRWHVSAFANREEIDSNIRGMVFNENQRRQPSHPDIQPIDALGPWTDPDRLFTTKMEDRTNTFGVGGGYELIPGRVKLSADYIISRGKVDWDYRGYGEQFDPSFDFMFVSPPSVKNNQYTLSAALEYKLAEGLVFGLHYLFDRFRMQDWMLEGEGPWVVEGAVAGEYLLQDSGLEQRWGNRLVNMGSPLWGSYEAHVGYVTMTYRF